MEARRNRIEIKALLGQYWPQYPPMTDTNGHGKANGHNGNGKKKPGKKKRVIDPATGKEITVSGNGQIYPTGNDHPLAIKIDYADAKRYASELATNEEIGLQLGFTNRSSFQQRIAKDAMLSNAIYEGRTLAKAGLRRRQGKLALQDGDLGVACRMSIWLGKQVLGQKEKVEIDHDAKLVGFFEVFQEYIDGVLEPWYLSEGLTAEAIGRLGIRFDEWAKEKFPQGAKYMDEAIGEPIDVELAAKDDLS